MMPHEKNAILELHYAAKTPPSQGQTIQPIVPLSKTENLFSPSNTPLSIRKEDKREVREGEPQNKEGTRNWPLPGSDRIRDRIGSAGSATPGRNTRYNSHHRISSESAQRYKIPTASGIACGNN
jgi:hypothetical protein